MREIILRGACRAGSTIPSINTLLPRTNFIRLLYTPFRNNLNDTSRLDAIIIGAGTYIKLFDVGHLDCKEALHRGYLIVPQHNLYQVSEVNVMNVMQYLITTCVY